MISTRTIPFVAGSRRIVTMGILVGALLTAPQFCRAAEDGKARIQAIQEMRISTLEELHKLLQRRYSQGQGDLGTVLEAMTELGEARMDSADTLEERTKALRKLVAIWKQCEAMTASRFESGMAPREDLLRVRAGRLKAELELARQKQKPRVQ